MDVLLKISDTYCTIAVLYRHLCLCIKVRTCFESFEVVFSILCASLVLDFGPITSGKLERYLHSQALTSCQTAELEVVPNTDEESNILLNLRQEYIVKSDQTNFSKKCLKTENHYVGN